MATARIYLPAEDFASFNASGDSTVTGFSWNTGWTAAAPGSVLKYRYGWANIPNIGNMPPGLSSYGTADTETSLTFSSGAFASSASRYGMRVVLGPLAAGATITGAQTLTAGINGRTSTFTNTVYATHAVQIRSAGDTLRKTMEAAGTDFRDATIWNTSFTSRHDTATSAATDYVTVDDDYIIWEIGVYNDFLDSESRYFEIGYDSAGTDATSTDSTVRRNSFLEVTYTGTLAIKGGGRLLMLTGCGL